MAAGLQSEHRLPFTHSPLSFSVCFHAQAVGRSVQREGRVTQQQRGEEGNKVPAAQEISSGRAAITWPRLGADTVGF